MRISLVLIVVVVFSLWSCTKSTTTETTENSVAVIDSTRTTPTLVTDTVVYDSDDPAIWINKKDPSASLIVGTDKGGDNGDGGLFVFNLRGELQKDKSIRGIKRPNNVDIAYGLKLNGRKVDIAVCTERNTSSIRVFSLPDMKAIDNGGIPVFEGDQERAPMGIALYQGSDSIIYAIVGRKTGPSGSYLWQYRLEDNGKAVVKATVVRKFGNYSGKNEIEAIAVDNELGYVYCSDESVGIRKYYVHPDSTTEELAFFGREGFKDNHEGISIYKNNDETGFIMVSDQQADRFQVFPREGREGNPHDHQKLGTLWLSTKESDGSDVTNVNLPGFPEGFFIAMSDDKTFQVYDWVVLKELLNKMK